MADIPTLGVEEEFLLVDPSSGAPVARNREVAEHAAANGVDLQLELTSCQVETATEVVRTTDALRDQLFHLRRTAAAAAERAGARLLAVGLPPTLPREFPITDKPRYLDIGERFGMIAHEQGICGCHVHVAVPDRDAAVAVANRLRPWLPTLLALTANSAIYRNADTGHSSWRSVLWARVAQRRRATTLRLRRGVRRRGADAVRHRRDPRRRHGLLGRAAVGRLPDRRGSRRRRAGHSG